MKHLAHKEKGHVMQSEKGFAMLFAVLVSSVLLSIGLSIFNLMLKEIALSSSGRESQFAFYAADTGIECALYWDFKASSPVMFATSSASQTGAWRDQYIDANSPSCVTLSADSLKASMKSPTVGQTSAVTRFSITIPNSVAGTNASVPYCVNVEVRKIVSNSIVTTVIDSRGYNTCDTTDPNRVERALKVTY
jgi:Tfp pilus assembly protein PilX